MAAEGKLKIDGGMGSGSGTVLRYALVLSALTGRELHLFRIRARREKPGLRHQHLAAAQAVRELCGGALEGAEVGSTDLLFRPGPRLCPGHYHWDIGTAGSASMLALNLLPLACLSPGTVKATITGGTFQEHAPTAFYLQQVLVPLVSAMGAGVKLELVKPGYLPQGGGELYLEVQPDSRGLLPFYRIDPGKVQEISGTAFSSHLQDRQVSSRMAAEARKVLGYKGYRPHLAEVYDREALQPGAAIALWARTTTGCLLGADAVGQPRRTSEQVGRQAARTLHRDLATGATVDRFAADQLVIFAALAAGESSYLIPQVTEHLETNLHLVELVLGARMELKDNRVTLSPR